MLRRVQKDLFLKTKLRFEVLLRLFARKRGFLLRCLLCWTIGCLVLSNDEINGYDQRFQLRGEQKTAPEIVLVTIRQSDFLNIYDRRTNYIGNMDQITDITDSFFWDKKVWIELLEKVLSQKPQSIGVTLYFGDNIGSLHLSKAEEELFKNPKIFWSSTTNSLERILTPVFSNKELDNLGNNELKRDEDGIVRRVFPQKTDIAYLPEKITGKNFPASQAGLPINFRGIKPFKEYSLSQIMYDEISSNEFTNKIIIIGAETSSGPQFMTPVGSLSRTEIIAHITDNLLKNRWIIRLHFWWYALTFIGLVFLTVFLITNYPQSVALFFLFWIATLIAALSAWVFDSFYIWLPAFSPFVLLSTTWIIFIGYQATKIERLNLHLQQEQKYLQELEQLKNNFVSLISHDLKTPIAKIQAIVDRLIMQNANEALSQDLKSLRMSSEELNKYIQSILKVLRVESRDFKLNKEVADINETIEEALLQLHPLAREKQITIETNLEPLFSLEYDPVLIKEVLINIIENAIKYTPVSGKINIQSLETEDYVMVYVQDTGDGIKPEDLDKVFGKFTRGSDQDLKTKGTGLGLYLVKYFIELHGGKVSLESKLGTGTKVSFNLPLTTEDTEEEIFEDSF